MNLVLARACSISCPYCFETAERKAGKRNFISIEDVTKLANWARDSGLGYLSLLGGEPFLHPQLGTIVTLFRQISPGTSLRILTGGVFRKRLLGMLPPEDVGLIFNINEPGDYRNPKHFAKVISNIETAIQKGFRVILGFNVWQTDFDPSFMPTLAHRFGRPNFRWTVANPQRDFPSNVVQPMQYGALAERCFAMLQEAARLNIEALLDCPVPLCFFNDAELSWVRQYHPGTAAGLGICYPVVDVTPELEVIRCFALSKLPRIKITDFSNEWEIQDWFLKYLDPQLLHHGCFSQCNECPHFKAGRCFGGCLAWHEGVVDMEAQPSASSLAQSMQESLEARKPDLALSQYESSNYWSKADIPTFTAAVAASQLGQREQALRYIAQAQNLTSDPELKQKIRELLVGIPQSDAAVAANLLPEEVPSSFVSRPRKVEGEANDMMSSDANGSSKDRTHRQPQKSEPGHLESQDNDETCPQIKTGTRK